VGTVGAEAYSFEDNAAGLRSAYLLVRADYDFMLIGFSDPDTGYMSGAAAGMGTCSARPAPYQSARPTRARPACRSSGAFQCRKDSLQPGHRLRRHDLCGFDDGQLYAISPGGTESGVLHDSRPTAARSGSDGTVTSPPTGATSLRAAPRGSLYWDYELNAIRLGTWGWLDGTIYLAKGITVSNPR